MRTVEGVIAAGSLSAALLAGCGSSPETSPPPKPSTSTPAGCLRGLADIRTGAPGSAQDGGTPATNGGECAIVYDTYPLAPSAPS